MQPFANLRDGGRQLADQLLAPSALEEFEFDQLEGITIAPIMPNGVPVALGMVDRLQSQPGPTIRLDPIEVQRTDEGVTVTAVPGTQNRVVVVVDDGVETGTAALAAGRAVRTTTGAVLGDPQLLLLLAVPVCPHQAMPELARVFDAVVAVHRPMARRNLTWHYLDFDVINDEQARDLLANVDTRT